MSLDPTIVALFALLVSLAALIHTLGIDRRNSRLRLTTRKETIVDALLEAELLSQVLYSNLLTVDSGKYIEEVQKTIIHVRHEIPKLLDTNREIRQDLGQFERAPEKALADIYTRAKQIRSSALGLTEMLRHGVERGLANGSE